MFTFRLWQTVSVYSEWHIDQSQDLCDIGSVMGFKPYKASAEALLNKQPGTITSGLGSRLTSDLEFHVTKPPLTVAHLTVSGRPPSEVPCTVGTTPRQVSVV
jgi:hypothetical protein